jgi:hypothetical protein
VGQHCIDDGILGGILFFFPGIFQSSQALTCRVDVNGLVHIPVDTQPLSRYLLLLHLTLHKGTDMLTELQVKEAQTTRKQHKLWDQGGLYLCVSRTGAKSWRYDYAIHGRRETVTFGLYPDFSLDEARELHAKARQLVARGESPAKAKRAEKQAAKEAASAEREAQVREKARAREEARIREEVLRRIPTPQISAFSEKKLSEITASEGVIFANAIASVLADTFADRVISRLEKTRAPSGEEAE